MNEAVISTMTEFAFTRDFHNSVQVNLAQEPTMTVEEFRQKLESSLETWRKCGDVKSVVFQVPVQEAGLVTTLSEFGFTVHHALDRTITLTKWLPLDRPNAMPPYSHHMVGVGGIVENATGQILAVRENSHGREVWKLPGGYAELGEDLKDAVLREVLEETSVQTEFVSMVSLRQMSNGAFGCSDLYFVAHLKATTFDLVPEASEILECRWLNFQDFLELPGLAVSTRDFVRVFLDNREKGLSLERTTGFHAVTKAPVAYYAISCE